MSRRLRLPSIVSMQSIFQIGGRTHIHASGHSAAKHTDCKPTHSVGATGFEPATSWTQTRRSSQTELRPESYSIVRRQDLNLRPVAAATALAKLSYAPKAIFRPSLSSPTEKFS